MRQPLPLHPLFFGAFPILFLYSQNADEMRLRALWGPLSIVLIITALAQLIGAKVVGSAGKAAILVSMGLFAFFSFGYLADGIFDFSGGAGVSIPILEIVLFLVAVGILYWGSRALAPRGERLAKVTSLLNFVAGGLVLIQLMTGGLALWKRSPIEFSVTEQRPTRDSSEEAPDIFFLLLDGYGREDVLRDLYAFDNKGFIESLERRGFMVANDGRASYIQTILSLASIFNLDLLESYASSHSKSGDRVALSDSIWSGLAVRTLAESGYSTVSFATGYSMSEFKGADRFLQPDKSLSDFSRLVISTTALRLVIDAETQRVDHRERIEFIFRKLPSLGGARRPRFVFAHIISPHPPFVLGPTANTDEGSQWHGLSDGSHRIKTEADRERYKRLYIEQLQVINGLVDALIDDLLSRPEDKRPVILIASDHGPGSQLHWDSMSDTDLRERLGTLLAVYFPDADLSETLPDPMSSTNLFRLVFNRYLGTDYPILSSRSFYSTWDEPFEMLEVEERDLRVHSEGLEQVHSR